MRCPSCGFVSFDHLTTCKKCGRELPPPLGGRRMPAPMAAAGAPPIGKPAAPRGSTEPPDTFVTGGGAAGPAAPSPSAEDTFTFTLPRAVAPPARSTMPFEPAAGAGLDVEFAPAGFWIRFVAAVVDSIILFVVMLVILVPIGFSAGIMAVLGDPMALMQLMAGLGAAFSAISILIPMLYEVIFVGWRGQTPGKMVLKLKIIRTDGGEVDYVKALIRWIGKLVSGFILGIGYIMAAFTKNKRALHDYIAGTRVIRL